MTSDWPKGLGSGEDSRVAKTDGNPLISRLAVKLKPRYHFSGTKGVFHERTPYRNHKVMSSTPKHCTRFITLAKVANAEKEKWIYAFNLVPMKHMERSELIAQPPSVTDIPYTQGDLEIKETSTQFFYDMKAPMEDKNRKRKGDKQDFKAKRQPREPQGPCWFCLSSAEVEKHLVVSITPGTSARGRFCRPAPSRQQQPQFTLTPALAMRGTLVITEPESRKLYNDAGIDIREYRECIPEIMGTMPSQIS